jgi:hypothetical protein
MPTGGVGGRSNMWRSLPYCVTKRVGRIEQARKICIIVSAAPHLTSSGRRVIKWFTYEEYRSTEI